MVRDGGNAAAGRARNGGCGGRWRGRSRRGGRTSGFGAAFVVRVRRTGAMRFVWRWGDRRMQADANRLGDSSLGGNTWGQRLA